MKELIHKTSMNAMGKSDGFVVPGKSPNKGRPIPAEATEERGPAEGNTWEQVFQETQCPEGKSIGLTRVREAAEKDKKTRFTSLLHHMDHALLRESFFSLKRNASPGVDEITWREYGENLDENLRDLHHRVHQGSYRALPARKTQIKKADGGLRTISIGAIEDKIVQQALVMILSPIYEADFIGFSYGYRPKRKPHDALDALSVALMRETAWVLDIDIKGFFDNLDHGWLLTFLDIRVGDPRVVRLIKKWLRMARMDEEGNLGEKKGTPQGAPISPLLANIYLHYALDLWVQRWRKYSGGKVYFIRFADDMVVGFQYKVNAEKFLEQMKEQLGKYTLEVHPTKTKLIQFGRFPHNEWKKGKGAKPGTFDFLGMTHVCGQNIKDGKYTVRRMTSKKKMRLTLQRLKIEFKKRRHDPTWVTGKWLRSVVRGHFNYYAVPGNFTALNGFRYAAGIAWLKSLRRRGQRHKMTWERFGKILNYWIPQAHIIHPHPCMRFYATHPR